MSATSAHHDEIRFAAWLRAAGALAAALAGLVTLSARLTSGFPSALEGHRPSTLVGLITLHLLGAAGGLGLLVLARGLWQGKRLAAYAAVVLLVLLGVGGALLAHDPVRSGLELAFAAVLYASRRAFPRGRKRPAPTVAVSGAVALACAAGLYAVYAAALLATARRTDVDRALGAAWRGLSEGHWSHRLGAPLALVLAALIATMLVAAASFARSLLRPVQENDGHLPEEHSRARAILSEYGSDSLDPFALREDKALHFAAGGFLAYRVLGGTAVVSGEPIGPPRCAPRVLGSFIDHATRQGWDVVVTGASEERLGAYHSLGLRALCIGEEAVVDPAGFSLEGRAIRKVRQSVSRVAREGWTIDVVEDGAVGKRLWAELADVEAAWRARQKRLVGFAMTLGRPASAHEDAPGLYIVARDPGGRVRSFLRFAECGSGLSLDLMRRPGDEPNGLMEAQVVAALDYAKRRGINAVSLNFAGFAHVMVADAVLSRSQRALRLALRGLHGRFQLERLMRFNAKFKPTWRRRHLLYQSRTQLPLAALRVLQAESYMPGPTGRLKEGRWEPSAIGPLEHPRGSPRLPTWARRAVVAAALCAGVFVSAEILAGGGSPPPAGPRPAPGPARGIDFTGVGGARSVAPSRGITVVAPRAGGRGVAGGRIPRGGIAAAGLTGRAVR